MFKKLNIISFPYFVKVVGIYILVPFSILIASCNKNNYKPIPEKYLKEVNYARKHTKYPSDAYFVVNDLPKNYVKDGSKDYTSILQNALKENSTVVLPNFPLLINSKGLTLPSDSNLYFQPKTKLILEKNDLTQYQILKIHDVKNVTVYNATIVGDKYKHIGNKGEWGMGISICGSQNIKIYNAKISQCWGDGLYLGITANSNKNINVVLENIICDDNRRNAMSIITAKNLYVNRMLVANTFGTSPMAGIDIEPDRLDDEIINLNFNNVISFNNKVHGFLFALNNMTVAENKSPVNIKISNLKIDESEYGLSFKLQPEEFKNEPGQGEIVVNNVQFNNISKKKLLSYEGNENNQIKVVILPNLKKGETITEYQKQVGNAKNILIGNLK